MTKKRTLDPEMIDSVAQNMFYALPLIKKRLLHMDIVQKEHGTPLSHVQVLAMLQDVGMMSVSEISRRLGIAKPNITPLVDRLFEAGYVDRQHDENDRRARFRRRRRISPSPSSASCTIRWKASFASSPRCKSTCTAAVRRSFFVAPSLL